MKTIYLIRHGESEGNIDKVAYSKKPDYAISLTDKGREQAKEAGLVLADLVSAAFVYYSPFFRARQTMQIATSKIFVFSRTEDARLREQEWTGEMRGFDSQREKDRISYGIYHYRYPGGESCADVELRVISFFESIKEQEGNILIFTHGMAMRVIAKYLLGEPIESFQTWGNPKNGEIWGFASDDNHRMIKNYRMTYGNIISKYSNPYQYSK